jgi:hypothetical protein
MGGMPILGGQDEREAIHQPVCDRYHLISVGDRQSSAWQKVILDVNHDECVHPKTFLSTTPRFRLAYVSLLLRASCINLDLISYRPSSKPTG